MRLLDLPLELQDEIVSLCCRSTEKYRTCYLEANAHLETWHSIPLGLLLTCRKLYQQTARTFSPYVRLVIFSTLCSAGLRENRRLFQQLHLTNVGRIDIRLRPPGGNCGSPQGISSASLNVLYTWMSCCNLGARCSNMILTVEKYALDICYDDLPEILGKSVLMEFSVTRHSSVWDRWEKAYRMKIDFSDPDSKTMRVLHLLVPHVARRPFLKLEPTG